MAEPQDINVDELRRRARRRLIGAVVLALAAAVIVPLLLENEPKPLGEDVAVKIPPEDSSRFVNRLSDKAAKGNPTSAKGEATREPAKVDSAPAAGTAPASSSETTGTPTIATNVPPPKKSIAQAEQIMLGAPNKASAATSPAPTPVPAAAPTAVTAPTPTPTPGLSTVAPGDHAKEGFSVQLAAFADDKGANSLANKLKRAAYPAYTEPLATSKGTLWRVRVGPFASRDEAIGVRDKLKGEGYSGIVAAAK